MFAALRRTAVHLFCASRCFCSPLALFSLRSLQLWQTPHGAMWSLLHSHSSLPLLAQPASRPQCSLDVGLHVAPVLPLMSLENSVAAADDSSTTLPRPPSVSMVNQRQRAPWFAAANIACVQAASPQLHPTFFAERQAQATHSAEAASALTASCSAPQAVGPRLTRAHTPHRRSRAVAGMTAQPGPESHEDDDVDPVRLHTAAAASDAALVPPVVDSSRSVAEQLAYFQRHLCSKRLAHNVPVSTPLEASTTERTTMDEFEREPLNDVPDELLTQLLQEDQQIRARERNEDLAQDRLVTLQTHWPVRIAQSAAAAAASPSSSSRPLSFAVFPAGALMEELALAELNFHSLGREALSSPQLSVTQLYSTPLDSQIRQVCLTAPVPAPPDLKRGAQPMLAAHAALPLIVSRTCQQMYVHALRLRPNEVAGAADSEAEAAPVASLLGLDSHCFPSPIVHMASNAAIPSEVAFLLQDASIWLWNMQEFTHDLLANLQAPASAAGATAPAVPKTTQRRFTVIPASRYWSLSFGSHLLQLPLPWGRIAFAPHPRSLVLVLQQAVLQIDVRAPYTGSSKVPRGKVLPIPALAITHDRVSAALTETAPGPIFPRLHAASISPRCPFHLLLISSDFLMLLDLRSPTNAMIEWRHHQSGEPPSDIEWLDTGDERSSAASASPCEECTERDQFFLTHNRSRNEVTLYHFATRAVTHQQQQSQQYPITSTFFSRFSPLRLQSIVHAEQRQSTDSAAATSDLPNPLVGLRVLRDPRVDPRVGLFHVLQLSEYGALVSQSFQHRHDDRSAATNSTVVPVRIPKAIEAEISQQQHQQQQQQQQSAARKRARDDDEEEESDIGEQKHSESDADSERMPPPAPRLPRGVPLSASKRAGLSVLLPTSSFSPLSLTRSSSLPLAASPSPHSSPPSLAALLAAPEKYERPWVQAHEIKPHRAVNLTAMLQSLAPEAKAATTAVSSESSHSSARDHHSARAPPTTFAHLVAQLIAALNQSQQSVQLFLSLPKTLDELARFLLDQRIVPVEILQTIAPEVEFERKHAAGAAASAATTVPSRTITPRGLHALAQLLAETMHAFLHATHGDDRPTHVPYHRDRWDALLPALLGTSAAPRLAPSTAAVRKRRRKFSGASGASARSDGESNAGAESDSSSRRSMSLQQLAPMPLNPFSASFPQPSFNVSHVHLALNRFAEAAGTEESTEGASLAAASCTCGHPSTRVGVCCCVPLCSSFHCMRLHSTLYTLAPSILCTAWPADRMERDADADAQQQLDDGAFPPLPSQPAFAGAAVGAGAGSGSFRTPAKHASFGAGAGGRRQTLGPVVDLSQDISFLLSQGTQPVAEEDEQAAEHPEESEEKKARDMHHALSSFMQQSQQPNSSASMQTLTQSSSADQMPSVPEEGEDAAAAAPPANPHGLRDMLCGMGESWRQFAELMHDAAAAQLQQSSSSAAAAAVAADASASLSSRFSDLSDWNGSLFRGWLVSHELEVDPLALAAQQAEIGEDMRGTTMDTMEEQGGRDED